MTLSNPNPPPSQTYWIYFAALGGLGLVCCCLAMAVYLCTLTFLVNQNISLIPSAPLDSACSDTDCLNMCIRRLPEFRILPLTLSDQRLLAERDQGYEIARYRLDVQTGQLEQVALPSVPDYLLSYQADVNLHRRIWEYFTTVFPNDSNVYTAYMVVYVNAAPEHFAARMQELDGKWRLHINLLDFNTPASVIEVLTHEYAHLLTLHQSQVKPTPNLYGVDMEREEFDEMLATCNGSFFSGYSCSADNAYLNAFGNRFWNGPLYEQWVNAFLNADNDQEVYERAIDQVYIDHPDEFVSMYAATNPREDIAESWTEFILRSKPADNSIAAQKVLFFYEYPQLIQARQHIIQGICQFAIDQK